MGSDGGSFGLGKEDREASFGHRRVAQCNKHPCGLVPGVGGGLNARWVVCPGVAGAGGMGVGWWVGETRQRPWPAFLLTQRPFHPSLLVPLPMPHVPCASVVPLLKLLFHVHMHAGPWACSCRPVHKKGRSSSSAVWLPPAKKQLTSHTTRPPYRHAELREQAREC